jgi:cupin 2 domain-containing protein
MFRPIQGNLLHDLPADAEREVFEDLLAGDGVRLERIVSTGQATPPGEWLQQEEHEWVLVLRGGGSVLLEGEAKARRLGPGDYLMIPSRTRHRVEETDPDRPTVWLAIHFGKSNEVRG